MSVGTLYASPAEAKRVRKHRISLQGGVMPYLHARSVLTRSPFARIDPRGRCIRRAHRRSQGAQS